MDPLLLLLIVAAVASRPIEARLWRAGRLSDRAAALLLIGRFPLLCLAFGLSVGMQPLLLAVLMAGPAVLAAVFYRPMLGILQDQASTLGAR